MSYPHERRKAPRFKAQLEVSLRGGPALLDIRAEDCGTHHDQLTILGYTYDVSTAGLSLGIPLFPVDKKFCSEEQRRLPLTFFLPTGPLEATITPLRCVALDEAEPSKGFLIGARIFDMGSEDRDRFAEYLGSIS